MRNVTKRKLFLSSTIIPALLATGAMGQVVNFHDDDTDQLSFPQFDVGYNELYAGQGAYADPGNDIWNGFGQEAGFGSTFFYSGASGSSGPFPQQAGNPGNPYAAYNSGAGWVTATGAGGGDLGYYGISNSAAFEINIFIYANGGSGVQFGTNGSTPDSVNPTAPYFTPGLVNVNSGDPINVEIYYNQGVETVVS